MAPIEPGTEWTLRRGVHSGTVVQIEGQSFAGSVKYRVVKKGDNTGSSSEDDDGRVHTKPQQEFLTLYQRSYKAVGNGMTQPAFRQDNQARRARRLAEEAAQVQTEVQLVKPTKVSTAHYQHPGQGLTMAVEMITPDMAQTWLDRGGINRKPSERAILKLVNAIQMGEWDLTGDTIKLDAEGKVRDGKHRLTAITRAGIAVPAVVVRGVKETAFDKIDTGKSRSMADVLSIHGHVNSIALATAARGLLLIENYGRYDVGGVRLGVNPTPSNAQGLAYVEAHPEIHDALKLAELVRKEGAFLGGTGLWTIVLTMFWRLSQEQTQVFARKLIDGANLEAGSPILRLRNMYRAGRDWHATTEGRERLMAIIIKAWNAWRRDELVQSLSWHNSGRSAEKFPVAE